MKGAFNSNVTHSPNLTGRFTAVKISEVVRPFPMTQEWIAGAAVSAETGTQGSQRNSHSAQIALASAEKEAWDASSYFCPINNFVPSTACTFFSS